MKAATIPQTGQFFYVPNSLTENQMFLTHAELAMALIVLRRSHSNKGGPISVSDENWKNWTGLSVRQKKYAIAGLEKKGLRVEGRGDKSRYSWHVDAWESYARQTAIEQRAKTDGRKPTPVPAKKGAMVHPDCANGCAMLQQEPAKLVLLPPGKVEQSWPETLDVIRQAFPLVSGAFLARLVGVVNASIGTVTDTELAHAVTVAYKRNQRREGLFLQTVPEALAAIRRVKVKPAPVAAGGLDRAAIERRIGEVLDVLTRDAWAPDDLLADLGRLQERATSTELQQLDDEMNALEKRIIEAAHISLGDPQRLKIQQRIAVKLKPYSLKMSREQLDQLGRQFLEHELMQYFGVPRLGAFYV
jgi:hypothetical protein